MTATYTDLLPKHEGPQMTLLWSPGIIPGCGVVEIRGKRDATTYAVVELPTDWNGRAFRLEKVAGEGTDATEEVYSVFCSNDRRQHRCECRGFSRWHHCKHIDAVTTIIANGWL
ncbi:hypothetical protein J8F10_06600 [Gemmata sp. G18]|uniref:SWIM-type domain-containing protein n=1 Tax=Gemmata palustris TaxID=2822762 RepID=A0ABS5BNQ9_9BACT|nr:hypothetical protein [Gemmata palustris]MBP3954950.1 hypothetical protein [Gemmata palustris]